MNKAPKPRIIFFAICIFLMALAFYFVNKKNSDSKSKSQGKQQTVNLKRPISILLLGADSLIPGELDGWNGRSDFIAYVYFNPHTDEVSILSIPRDTYIELKKHKIHRINSANQIGGYRLSMRAVCNLLDIKHIDHVFVFSLKAVVELLDQIGPLKIFVPKKMFYNDMSADLHIDFKPGLQKMNGEQLIKFLRYRDAVNGDIGRIQRQHMFFRAMINKVLEPQMIFKIPTIINKINKVVITDMSFSEMFKLGTLVRSLAPSRIKGYILPGDFGSDGSWRVNYPQLRELMAKILKAPKKNDKNLGRKQK
jgi:LCP family protein required for cell wall assembly